MLSNVQVHTARSKQYFSQFSLFFLDAIPYDAQGGFFRSAP